MGRLRPEDEPAGIVAAGIHRTWRHQVGWAPHGRVETVDGLVLYRSGHPDPSLSVALVGTAPSDPTSALRTAREALGSSAGALFADLEMGRYPAVEEAARTEGLVAVDRRRGMTLDLAGPGGGPRPGGPTATVATVHDPAGLDAARAVQGVAFGMPAATMRRAVPAAALDDDAVRFHLWRVGDEVVSAAMTVEHGTTVGLFGVATVRDHRGRGHAARFVGALLDRARRAGAETAWLLTTALSESLYRGLGFRPVSEWRLWGPAPPAR